MTASLHRLGAGRSAGTYYTNDSARELKPKNRDNYYGKDGEGFWWSSGETLVRHQAPVDLTTFQDLCAGYDPQSVKPAVRGAGPQHWAGVDCTFTLGKSASILWMAGTAEQRTLIESAHRAAVDQALHFIEREGLIVVRSGAGGKYRDRPTDLIAACFHHFTTREGDPNCHTHCVFMNVAGRARDGGRYNTSHLTIDPVRLFEQVRGVGAAFRAAAAEQLGKHGFTFRAAGRGQWEIVGIPEEMIEAFSKRSHQIEALVGRDASGAQKEVAALATRSSKATVPSGAELEVRWRAELGAFPRDPWWAALTPAPDRDQAQDREHGLDRGADLDPPDIPGTTPVAMAASALFRHESVISRAALLEQSLVQASLQGRGIETVYDEIARLEQDSTLMRLGAQQQQNGQLWTTPSIAKVEAAMLRAANRPAERAWFSDEAVDTALQAAPHLSAEQRQAVWRAASPDGISIIEAGAGTGKTTAAKAIRDLADRSGVTVIGLAPSWVAANELSVSIGIQAHAIAKWRYDLGTGTAPAFDERTMLLVDEAGMASMRDMAAIVTAAKEAGTKVVLLGDSRQLESVPGGSALRALTEVVRQNAVMQAIRRQQTDWQRAASMVMARGDAEAGLRAYAERGHIELVAGTEAAMDRVLDRWRELRLEHGADVLIVTRRNADASILNRKVRTVLRSEHRLTGEDVALPSIDRENKRVELHLAVGDLLRFGDTLADLQIWNGSRGTVEAVRDGETANPTLRIRLEDGRVVEQPWASFARRLPGRPQQSPRIVHAYAGTAYSAQGRTAAATVHYIGSATDARETYVALTRHRHDVRVVVERDRLEAACRLRQVDGRLAPTRTDLEERLFREASQYSEKSNVVDHVADRQAFIATGVVTVADTRPKRSTGRLMEAARALRSALHELSHVEIAIPGWRLVGHSLRLLIPLPARLSEAVACVRRGPSADQNQTRKHDYGLDR